MADLYAGIDLGGTNVRAVVATADGKIRGKDKRASRASEGLDATLSAIDECLGAACQEAGVDLASLAAVGIATPGWVDLENGVVPAAPQLRGWKDVPIVRILQDRLGLPVTLENDANAAAIGEHAFGAGRGVRHLLYITVSTGIGGGLVIDGKPYGGARGSAGEIGHTVVDPRGPPCPCGSNGCLEVLASGTAIALNAESAAERGESAQLAEIRWRDGRLSARTVSEAASAGDEAALRIYAEAGRYLGLSLGNAVDLLSPEMIIIGGGVARSAPLFLSAAEATMKETSLSEPLRHVRLVLSELWDEAGVLGMIARITRA